MSIQSKQKDAEFDKIVETQRKLEVLKVVKQMIDTTPNDADLGRKIRGLINLFKENE